MGYFDGIVDGSFKTTDDGVLLFYPYGVLGKGYIIPSIEKKLEVRKHLKRFTIFSLTTIVISASSMFPSMRILNIPWWAVGLIYFAIILVLTLIGHFISRRFTKGLITIDKKLTVAESYQNSAKSHNALVLVLLEIISFLFVGAGVWMLFDSHLVWYFRLNGLLSILFSGFASIAIGYMISAKLKK